MFSDLFESTAVSWEPGKKMQQKTKEIYTFRAHEMVINCWQASKGILISMFSYWSYWDIPVLVLGAFSAPQLGLWMLMDSTFRPLHCWRSNHLVLFYPFFESIWTHLFCGSRFPLSRAQLCCLGRNHQLAKIRIFAGSVHLSCDKLHAQVRILQYMGDWKNAAAAVLDPGKEIPVWALLAELEVHTIHSSAAGYSETTVRKY